MEAAEPRELTCSSSSLYRTKEENRTGHYAGVVGGPLGLPPPAALFFFHLHFLFFFVEKRREEKKGKRGIKIYNNNFYELPFSKMFRFTSFGSEIFEISNYLKLKLNWHFGFNNRKII